MIQQPDLTGLHSPRFPSKFTVLRIGSPGSRDTLLTWECC